MSQTPRSSRLSSSSSPSSPRFSSFSQANMYGTGSDPIVVAKLDALQEDVNRLLEHNLQMRRVLEEILEKPRSNQRHEKIKMNFETPEEFADFNEALKDNLQKKNNLVHTFLDMHHSDPLLFVRDNIKLVFADDLLKKISYLGQSNNTKFLDTQVYIVLKAAYKDRYKEDDQRNRFTEYIKTSLKLGKNIICKRQRRAIAKKRRTSTMRDQQSCGTSAMSDQQDQEGQKTQKKTRYTTSTMSGKQYQQWQATGKNPLSSDQENQQEPEGANKPRDSNQ